MNDAAAALEARIEARYTDRTPSKGDWVVVYKGRKVAKGTEGTIIWTGDKGWGLRVGIKDDAGDVHWTAATNVRVDVADKASDESWVDYDARIRAEADAKAALEAELAAKRPAQWDIVVLLDEDDFIGKVFWLRDDRIGVAREGARRVRINGQLRNKPEDVRWVGIDDVCKRALYIAPEPEAEVADEAWADEDMGCF